MIATIKAMADTEVVITTTSLSSSPFGLCRREMDLGE